MGFLHHMTDKSIASISATPKSRGSSTFLTPSMEQGLFTTSCTSYSQIVSPSTTNDFILVHDLLGQLDGMTNALPVHLVYIMSFQIRIFTFYIILDLIAKVSDNKNKFIDACFFQLVNNNTENCFPASGIRALGCV